MRVTRWQSLRRAAPHVVPPSKGSHPATSVLDQRRRQQHCSTGAFTIWAMLCCQPKVLHWAVHLYAVCCSHNSRPVSWWRCVLPTGGTAPRPAAVATKPRPPEIATALLRDSQQHYPGRRSRRRGRPGQDPGADSGRRRAGRWWWTGRRLRGTAWCGCGRSWGWCSRSRSSSPTASPTTSDTATPASTSRTRTWPHVGTAARAAAGATGSLRDFELPRAVVHAARDANAHDFIMKHGFATQCRAGGGRLSGGQK